MREEDHNVPLNLRRVLAAMKSDRPLLAPHQDFLSCLERNRIRRKEERRSHVNLTAPAGDTCRVFTGNTQHDADQVFLFILDVVFQQIDDKRLVG